MKSGRVGIYAIDTATGALERTGSVAAAAGANWVEIVALA